MGWTTIVLLFTKDRNFEPSAILQYSTTGKFLEESFNSWKEAVHYLLWVTLKNKSPDNVLYEEWSNLYGYSEEGEFIGNLYEFNYYDWSVDTSIGEITNHNFASTSAWDE